MSRKALGASLMGLGALLIIAAVAVAVGSGGGDPEAVDTTSTTAPASTTTLGERTTTSQATTTSAPTTTLATTTTTADATSLVEGFIVDLGDAISSGDTDAVFSSLHPDIVEGFGSDVCRNWVETQIMALVDYRSAGNASGPTPGSLQTPNGVIVFDERFSVPISFTFNGQDLETTADFVILDGEVYFTGTCE